MKIIDQGKFKLNTSKAVAIERFLELGSCCEEYYSNDETIFLDCTKSGEISISHFRHRTNRGKNAYILSKLYGQIIEQKGETYVSYYTALTGGRIFLFCGMIVLGLILSISLFLTSLDLRALFTAVGFVIALIWQVSSLLDEKNQIYMHSKKFVKILERKVDAVNNWEK